MASGRRCEVTGPGTAITGRPNFRAQLAVLRAPLRQPASTTTTPSDNAATSRFLARNRNFAGVVPGGYSLITAPELAICLSSRACPDGYARSTPQAKTASVVPPTPNAARCAAPSIPKAAPEITVHPSTARSPAISAVTCSPYAVDAACPQFQPISRSDQPNPRTPTPTTQMVPSHPRRSSPSKESIRHAGQSAQFGVTSLPPIASIRSRSRWAVSM